MEIEDLTKSQLILLAVMVSFVTSIATGIFTVTFLVGEPVAIYETVNRIVERTVEKQIVPVKESVVVRPSEKVAVIESHAPTAAALVEPALVELLVDPENGQTASGFLVSKDGLVVLAASSIPEHLSQLQVRIADGTKYSARVVARNSLEDIALVQIVGATSPLRFVVLAQGSSALVPGQSLFSFSAEDKEALVFGNIASIASIISSTSTPLRTVFAAGVPRAGTPVLTTQGTLVGIWTGQKRLVRSDTIQAILKQISTENQI